MKALRNIQTLLTYSEPIEHFTPELNLLKCRAYNIVRQWDPLPLFVHMWGSHVDHILIS